MKEKYKSLYIFAFFIFLLINVLAIFFVFKKYRSDSKQSQMITKTKFRFSKVKEKIANIESKIDKVNDSISIAEFEDIQLEKKYLDSILSSDKMNEESLREVSGKIYDISAKSNQLEQTIDSELHLMN